MLDQEKDDVENITFVQNSFKSSSEFNLSYFMDSWTQEIWSSFTDCDLWLKIFQQAGKEQNCSFPCEFTDVWEDMQSLSVETLFHTPQPVLMKLSRT